jgi:hypothetical protein
MKIDKYRFSDERAPEEIKAHEEQSRLETV